MSLAHYVELLSITMDHCLAAQKSLQQTNPVFVTTHSAYTTWQSSKTAFLQKVATFQNQSSALTAESATLAERLSILTTTLQDWTHSMRIKNITHQRTHPALQNLLMAMSVPVTARKDRDLSVQLVPHRMPCTISGLRPTT